MTSIYRNKQEALKGLESEMKACRKYAKASEEKAKEGKIGVAINLLDIAQTAKTCAEQAHESLWELSKGNRKEKEFEIFCDSETLRQDINKAYQAIKEARN